jgi:hypothetical protein
LGGKERGIGEEEMEIMERVRNKGGTGKEE